MSADSAVMAPWAAAQSARLPKDTLWAIACALTVAADESQSMTQEGANDFHIRLSAALSRARRILAGELSAERYDDPDA